MDTLVKDPVWSVFPAFFDTPIRDLFAQKDAETWPAFEKGLLDEETYFRTSFKDGRQYDGEALKQQLKAGYRFIDGIEDMLAALKDRGVEMHVLSNYPVWYRMIEDKLGLTRFMPWTFVSTHTGFRKPDPQTYEHAAKTIGRPAEDFVFVDDRTVNVDAAQALGMAGHTFVDTPALRTFLQQRGIL